MSGRRRSIGVWRAAIGLVGLCAWMAGCANAPKAAAPVGPPEDFALAVTRPPGVGGAEMPGMRWILEPGGALRAAAGEGVRSTTYPPISRRLTDQQVSALWSLASAASGGQQSAGSERAVAEAGGTALWVRAGGESKVVRIDGTGGGLIAELQRLTWMR